MPDDPFGADFTTPATTRATAGRCSTPRCSIRPSTCWPSWRARARRSSCRRHRPGRPAPRARGVPCRGSICRCHGRKLRNKKDAAGIDVTVGDMARRRRADSGSSTWCSRRWEPHHPGGAGRLLRQRRRPPRARRLLRDRERRPRSSPPPTGRGRPGVRPEPGYVGYDRYTDLVAQQATSHHFVVDDAHGRELTTPFRFVWPSELDLWPGWPGCRCATAGPTGSGRRSPVRARSTSRCGRSDRPRRDLGPRLGPVI